MQSLKIQRVLIWSRFLRIAHWTMALSVLVLLATGWLATRVDPPVAAVARDIHYGSGALLMVAFALRLYLLFFGRGSDLLSDCETDRHRLGQALQMLRFYLSLGRAPLPRWYAHNPLWGPLYLLLFVFLLLQIGSGLLLLEDVGLLGGLSIYALHQLGNLFLLGFSLLHLLAVFSHDAKGTGSDNSAMISGYRIVVLEEPELNIGVQQALSLDQLTRQLKDRDKN